MTIGSDEFTRVASHSAGENLAPDQHTPNFRGSGTDLVELGVAQKPACGKVVDVAVAAQRLDRLKCDLGRPLGREQDAAGGVHARGLATIARRRYGIDVGAG